MPEADRGTLTHDADTLLDLYGSGGSLKRPKVDDLASRYGYFGKVAGVWGKPETDPERTNLLGGVGGIIALFLGLAVFGVGLFLASAACFITAIVLASTGRLRSRFRPRPARGQRLPRDRRRLLRGLPHPQDRPRAARAGPPSRAAPSASSCSASSGPWPWSSPGPSSAACPSPSGSLDTGLHAGQGFFKEAFCGLGAYLAGLPIVLGALWVTLQLMRLVAGGQDTPKHNAILDGVSQGGIFLVLIFALATLWAPLVERPSSAGPSTATSAAAWASSSPPSSPPSSSGPPTATSGSPSGPSWPSASTSRSSASGGSLVGPIVMHALNNATVLLLVLSLFSVMKD